MPILYLEWIDYMNSYRVFDYNFPQQSIAYVDSINDAILQHPEYSYVIV